MVGVGGTLQFWSWKRTFTGGKFTGVMGKGGNVGGVLCVLELMAGNNRVVSGGDRGYMMVWEDGYVVGCIGRVLEEGCGPMHDGGLHVIQQLPCDDDDDDDDWNAMVFTAGADGCLRWWLLQDILTADTNTNIHTALRPLRVVQIYNYGPEQAMICKVLCMPGGREMIVQEGSSGSIRRVIIQEDDDVTSSELFMCYHSGTIKGVAVSPMHTLMATIDDHGSIVCWDYRAGRAIAKLAFVNIACSVIRWIAVDGHDPWIIVGFSDGCLRVLTLQEDDNRLQVKQLMRPHCNAISCITCSPCSQYLATVGEDQRLFFFKVDAQELITSVGFVHCHGMPSCLHWSCKNVMYVKDDRFVMEAVGCDVISRSDSHDEELALEQRLVRLQDGDENENKAVNKISTCNNRKDDGFDVIYVCDELPGMFHHCNYDNVTMI